MSLPQLERMREHCHRRRLFQSENELTACLEQATKREVSYADFLDGAGETNGRGFTLGVIAPLGGGIAEHAFGGQAHIIDWTREGRQRIG
jgi:hypothetical protein